MRVTRFRKALRHLYSLGNGFFQRVSYAKYLGIQIDNKLGWNKHISPVTARGQSKLAFLNRNLKGCPKKLRDTVYISLIRPSLDYSCSVWHLHKKSNKDKIEKVQRRAARFVSNKFKRKSSVSEMLHLRFCDSLVASLLFSKHIHFRVRALFTPCSCFLFSSFHIFCFDF